MDQTTKPRTPSLNWKAAVDELTRGRDLASQLGAVLEEASPTSTIRDLLRKVSDSFSRALVALGTGVKPEEEKGESVRGKKREMESGQRGGCRRRRRVDDSCKSTITTTTLNDGHSWRKYGQKVILNYKSPRGYYRCAHKSDQKCLATRRVQQSEENPSLFVIAYTGEHTCRELPADAFASLETDPCIIDFSRTSTTTISNQERGFSANYFLSAKQESDIEEAVSGGDVVVLKSPGSSSSGCLAAPELGTLDESARLVEELMGLGGASEHCDVTSACLQPSSSIGGLGWDFMDDDDSFDISCVFDYNQGGALY